MTPSLLLGIILFGVVALFVAGIYIATTPNPYGEERNDPR